MVMITENIEKAEKVAQEFIEAREKAKAEAEAAKITPEQKAEIEKNKAAEAEKAEAELKAKAEVEAKAEEILEKPEDELTDEEKKLLEEISKDEEGLDEKTRMERGLKKSRKRIDKLTAKLREAETERETLISGVQELRKEIEALKQGLLEPKKKEDTAKKLSDEERSIIATAMQEDAELPREQRREMVNEELQEWFSEDPVAAQEWIAAREVRRAELKRQLSSRGSEKENADKFLKAQEESIKRAVAKYPKIKPDAELSILLKSNTQEEVIEILEKKYPEYKLCNQIVDEAIENQKQGKESILSYPDFGDRLMVELEKRMTKDKAASAKTSEKKVYTEEEVAQRIKEAQEMERQRLARVDNGASSTSLGAGGTPKKDLTPDEEFLRRHGQKAGLTSEQIDRIIKRHNDRMRSGHFARHDKKDPEDE